MVSNIQRLLYLCQVKNDLNRKRRRFWYYMNRPHLKRKCKGGDKCPNVINRSGYDCRGHHFVQSGRKHICVPDAGIGYRKAQADMKAMTKEMRAMRIEMGVEFQWSDHGAIRAVKYQGVRISEKYFKEYYDAEIFEQEVFKR